MTPEELKSLRFQMASSFFVVINLIWYVIYRLNKNSKAINDKLDELTKDKNPKDKK